MERATPPNQNPSRTPNYAINPTPEQTLRSNRAVLPARVIAALAFMRVRYSSSYIDRLYQERDIFALESVVEVVGGDQRLPEEFWLSMRLLAWCGWSRSGIWQYYEQISPEGFEAVAAALGKFGLAELEARYRAGMENWKKGGGCRELDEWIVMNQSNIEATSFELISCLREHLYATE